ncbi:MAG TPA: hypothetical protein VK574_11180 [Terracidiphilus sp.]|nr:hypothetical protein [Terracidiphilus sp.]
MLIIAAAALSGVALCAQSSTTTAPFDNEERLGLEAVANNRYEEATEHFQRAVQMEPSKAQALLYLAFAQSESVVPGVQSPDNLKAAQAAVETLNGVLALEPNDGFALSALSSVYLNFGQSEKAKEIELRILAAEPRDFDADYQVGAIDWFIAFRNASERLKQVHLSVGGGYPRAGLATCKSIATVNDPLLSEAVEHLDRAHAADPKDSDSLSYLSLVYQLRAGTHCTDRSARAADLAKARDTIDKAIAIRHSEDTITHPHAPAPPSRLSLPDEFKSMVGVRMPPPPPPPPPPAA